MATHPLSYSPPPLHRAPARVLNLANVDLLRSIQGALPALSARVRVLIEAMVLAGGRLGPADRVASGLGLRDRFALARWLADEGLPPLHELAGWISVLRWTRCQWYGPPSLCAMALRSDRDPAACYRLVRRVTGRGWSDVKALGTAWVLAQFAMRCRQVSAKMN